MPTTNIPPTASLWMTIKRWSRFQYLRIMRTAATPHSLALGMGAGIFVGFLPIVPLQSITVITMCIILRGNAVAGFAGTWISNPFNWVPFYYFLYVIGKLIVPWDPPALDIEQFSQIINDLDVRHLTTLSKDLLEALKIMMIAGVCLGIPAGIASYFVTRKAVVVFRKKRALRILKKRCAWLR